MDESNAHKRNDLEAELRVRNISERVVDKDNHLRDCLKYLVLSLPSPADTPLEVRVSVRLRPSRQAHK